MDLSFSSVFDLDADLKIRPRTENTELRCVGEVCFGLSSTFSISFLTVRSITLCTLSPGDALAVGGRLVNGCMLSSSILASVSMPLTDMELGIADRLMCCVEDDELGDVGSRERPNEPIDCELGTPDVGRAETSTKSSSTPFIAVPMVGIECIESDVAMLALGDDSADAYADGLSPPPVSCLLLSGSLILFSRCLIGFRWLFFKQTLKSF